MLDLMIDLETLGTRVNCPVIAIGACFFDPTTGEIGAKFKAHIKPSSAMQFGSADGDTISWWLRQSEEARRNVYDAVHEAPDAFKAFYDFCLKHGDDVRPWGNGSSFDISILEYAFPKILGRKAPWRYNNVLDCRTIKRLAEAAKLPPFKGAREGTHHAALDDAIFQAGWVSYFWRELTKPTIPGEVVADLIVKATNLQDMVQGDPPGTAKAAFPAAVAKTISDFDL